MSMAALRWARTVRGISATQKFVLVMLADMANDYGEAWPSALLLAADCCLTDRAVRDAMDALEQRGLISGERVKGRATRWRIHIGAAPEPASATPERRSDTPERGSALPSRKAPRKDVPTPPERGSDPPRNLVPVTPERGSDRTLKNPHTTPKKPSNARAKPPAVEVSLPGWLPPDAWADWCQHRIGLSRKGWTHAAAVRCIRDLERFRDTGDDPRAVIDQSIAGGWTGLFPLKRGRGGAQPTGNDRDWFAREIGARMNGAAHEPVHDHAGPLFDGQAEELPR